MRITITTTDPALTFMRRAGYGFQKEGGGEVAFVRRVGGLPFPRYHAYVHPDGTALAVNLHVDQKEPTYGRGTAHSGEYNGTLVEEEAARLRAFASAAAATPSPATRAAPKKKSLLDRLFGGE